MPLLRLPAPHPQPIGARLRLFLPKWKSIGAGQWVLQTIGEGLTADLFMEPIQFRRPPETTAFADHPTLEAELEANLLKASVERVPEEELDQPAFYSSQFTVPKRDTGKHRQVSNLRALNNFITPHHFKMEGLFMLPYLLNEKDWMTSLDIKDAFFHIPIRPCHMDLFRFTWKGIHYRFRAMPFGLSSAPRIFTKVLKPVVGFLRSKGLRCIVYLDDILIIASSREESLLHTQWAIDLLHDLGFQISWDKSQLSPSQQAEFLGFLIDSLSMSIQVPQKKLDALTREVKRILRDHSEGRLFSPRQLAGLVGRLQATCPAFEHAPLRVRETRACYIRLLHGWDKESIRLSPPACEELSSWLHDLHQWNGRAIIRRPVSLVLVTDASRTGWGGFLHRPEDPLTPIQETWGFWAPEESNRSSNWREATATLYSLRAFKSLLRGQGLLIRSDNQSNVSALSRKGSSVLTLNAIATESLTLCRSLNVQLTIQHVPGVQNTRADWLSRIQRDPGDWKLHPDLFEAICRRWYRPTVDCFATSTNCQTQRFFSYRPDPFAVAQDAFLQDWTKEDPYGNPPFLMVGQVLAKINQDQVPRFILIAPLWSSAPWWPLLIRMMTDVPLLLPKTRDTYLPGNKGSTTGVGRPSWDSAAFLLSGRLEQQEAFLKKLSSFSPRLSDLPQRSHTTDIGIGSALTWIHSIPFRMLRK